MATHTIQLTAVVRAIRALVDTDASTTNGYADLPADVRLEQYLRDSLDLSQRKVQAAIRTLKADKILIMNRGKSPSQVKMPRRRNTKPSYKPAAHANAARALVAQVEPVKAESRASTSQLDETTVQRYEEIDNIILNLAEFAAELAGEDVPTILRDLHKQILTEGRKRVDLERENAELRQANSELKQRVGELQAYNDGLQAKLDAAHYTVDAIRQALAGAQDS